MMNIRTYSELISFNTFKERFEYLKLDGFIGKETFGYDRYLNQLLYKSSLWKQVRQKVIIRDLGCDLGLSGYELQDILDTRTGRTIKSKIIVHHMNPILIEDLQEFNPDILDPEYLITTSQATHNALHYGNLESIITEPIVRTLYDTCPWKNERRF